MNHIEFFQLLSYYKIFRCIKKLSKNQSSQIHYYSQTTRNLEGFGSSKRKKPKRKKASFQFDSSERRTPQRPTCEILAGANTPAQS